MINNIIWFEEIDSTNDYLKENYHKYEEGTVIGADYQTSGHGRMGRTWIDKPKENLTFSLLLKPAGNLNLPQLTILTCVSLFEVLKEYLPTLIIKWPNDLLVGSLKLSGILTESIFLGNKLQALIIGVGINVNTKYFPDQLKDKSTSIFLETGREIDIESLLQTILNSFNNYYQKFLSGGKQYQDIYKSNFPYIGRLVEIIHNGHTEEVLILDVLDNGNILVLKDQRSYELSFGEISIKR